MQELPFSMIGGSITVSPDEKYAVIVPETCEKSENNVYILDLKTLKVQGKSIQHNFGSLSKYLLKCSQNNLWQ